MNIPTIDVNDNAYITIITYIINYCRIHVFCIIEEIGQYEYNILKNVDLPIVPREECTKALKSTRLGAKFILHESFICAGGVQGKDTCKVSSYCKVINLTIFAFYYNILLQ